MRATPDTPEIEAQAAKQGRAVGPQTVIYTLYANSEQEAIDKAIQKEMLFTHRKNVWLFQLTLPNNKTA